MRSPTAPLLVSYLLVLSLLSPLPSKSVVIQAPDGPQNPSAAPQTPAQDTPTPDKQVTAPATGSPKNFVLQDGTPIKLRLSRNVSSADATVGESVDFEVLEDVIIDGSVVVPKGGLAMATVTEAVPKRRMGRAGKLEIVMDYVRLADKEKAAVRAVKDAKGGSRTAGMTIGIVATGLLFWPAAPLFLLMHGKDITIPKGAEITAYVNGDQKLMASSFLGEGESFVPLTSSPTANVPATARPESIPGSYEILSDPLSAELYVDGNFIGNTPATLKLKAGQHTIRITFSGYKEWSRDVIVQEGMQGNLKATLQKQD